MPLILLIKQMFAGYSIIIPQLWAVVNVYNQTFPVFSEFVRYLTNKNTSVDIRKIYKIVLRKTKNRDILEKNTEDESHENRIVCYQHLFHGMCSRNTCACSCQNQSQIKQKQQNRIG